MRAKRKISYFVGDDSRKLVWYPGHGGGWSMNGNRLTSRLKTHIYCRHIHTALRHVRRIHQLGGNPVLTRNDLRSRTSQEYVWPNCQTSDKS